MVSSLLIIGVHATFTQFSLLLTFTSFIFFLIYSLVLFMFFMLADEMLTSLGSSGENISSSKISDSSIIYLTTTQQTEITACSSPVTIHSRDYNLDSGEQNNEQQQDQSKSF